MLRYNTNPSGIPSKPVDYYRPLTVDVSVEYELPKEVAPPKGSAPLLIIHPSAYFRPKPTSSGPSPIQTKAPPVPPIRNATTGLGEIASTLYYLSTNGLPPPPSIPIVTSCPPVKGQRSDSNPPSRSTRSRTSAAAKQQALLNCDDYRNTRLGSLPHNQHGLRFQGSGVIKKVGQPYQNQFGQNQVQDGSGGGYGQSVGINGVTGSSFGQGQQQGQVQSTARNKRLRMMNNQNSVSQTNSMPIYGSSGGGMVMEPLNLALTPTYNNHFSTFLGYSGSTNQNYGTNIVQQPNFLSAHAQRALVGVLKEGPVPVDKGSGSDSGVCSENDSDDVSPPMAATSTFSTTTSTSQISRRSNLQEFPNAGCYCCCCPTTSTSSGRRGVTKGTVKGHQPQTSSTTTAFPTGLTNYGNLFNVIHQQQQQILRDSGGGVQPHGGSPMDSSAPPPLLHHQQSQRKWLGSTTMISELSLPGPQVPTTTYAGKWFQV